MRRLDQTGDPAKRLERLTLDIEAAIEKQSWDAVSALLAERDVLISSLEKNGIAIPAEKLAQVFASEARSIGRLTVLRHDMLSELRQSALASRAMAVYSPSARPASYETHT